MEHVVSWASQTLGLATPTGGLPKSRSTSNFESAGMSIIFKGLTCTVPSNSVKGEQAVLLQNVSGVLHPGNLSALMGPSGSGKTTLLDVLAGRKTTGSIEGTILFGGVTPSRAFLRRYTGYVEQFDTLLGILTVEEMLLYTAELKRPMSEPLASKKAAVEQLLDALALTPCRDVKIGNPMAKGISGGQAKRTNIGIALITNPRVLFLDEPTSGLDSYTANEVMSVVHALRTSGVTVCATIHSPTATAFGLFDALMMLVRGRVVYFGSAGRQAVDYALASWSSGGKGLDPGASSAEFLVDLITAADRDGRAAAFADIYARSPLAAASAAALEMLTSPARRAKLPKHLAAELAVQHETVTPLWWGLKTLLKYRTPRNYRDPEFLGPRIGEPLFVVTLMWSLYWGVGSRFDGDNFVNQAALLYFWVVLPAYGAASYVPAIVLERTLYTRERADGLYLPITYLLAKMIEELLLAISVSVINAAAGFHAIGFAGSFGVFWLVYAQCLAIGIVLAYWIAAASPNMDAANALLPAYVTVQLFFAGFILDFRTMPGYWKWYSYLDFMRYAWGALMVNQYSGEQGDPVWLNNQTVLEHYQLKNYKDSSSAQYTMYKPTVEIGPNVMFLVMFFLGYFCLAWATLKYKVYAQR